MLNLSVNKKRRSQFINIGKWLPAFSIAILVPWYYKIVFGIEFNEHDDLLTLSQVQHLGVIDIFRSTIIDSTYYRPVIQLVMKVSYILFSDLSYPIRLVQITLHLSTLWLFYQICMVLHFNKSATFIGMLLFCFSPFTYVGIAKYGIEIGTYLLSFLFFLVILQVLKEKVSIFFAVVITIFALLTREQGLLIALTFFLYFSFRANYRGMINIFALICLYLFLRGVIIGEVAEAEISSSTGWFFEFLSASELNELFGEHHYILFAYNVLSHLFSIALYIPIKGQLIFSGYFTLLLICTSILTSALIAFSLSKRSSLVESHIKNKDLLLLLLVMIANAVIAYSYCRYRMLFMSGLSMSILFSYSINFLLLNAESKKYLYIFVILAFVFWSVVGVMQLNALERKSIKISERYKKKIEVPIGVDSLLYNSVRNRINGVTLHN